jgi:glycosyltransferase involved in cell wall biosynthesis
MPGYRTDLKDIYSAMDIFLYPPLEKDTSPLALVSAISSGLPVAVSNIESLHEITDLCPDIDTFDPRSKDEIIFIMKKYENINIRISNGIQNEKSGKVHFDISSHAMKMIQIFTEQISNNK